MTLADKLLRVAKKSKVEASTEAVADLDAIFELCKEHVSKNPDSRKLEIDGNSELAKRILKNESEYRRLLKKEKIKLHVYTPTFNACCYDSYITFSW